jgi:hypothetical protein
MAGGPEPTDQHYGRPPRRYWKASVRPHWIEVILTIALIVVGGFQVGIYLRQASIMDKQADIATAANKQNAIVNAAFVYAKTINFAGPNTHMTGGNDWIAGIQWENSGNIQTHDLLIAMTYTGSPQPQKFPVFPSFKDIEKTGAFLGPKASSYLSLPISGLVLSEIQVHRLYVYIFGRATYRDPINPRDDRLTRVCWELSYVPADVEKFTGPTFLPHCAIHTCADGECAREDREHPEAAPK